MVKKLLVAALILGSLSFAPAEARRGRCCKRETSCPVRKDTGCNAPTKECSKEKVLVRVDKVPCCKTVKVQGYRECPIYKEVTTCTSSQELPCKPCLGPCIYPDCVQLEDGKSVDVSSASADME